MPKKKLLMKDVLALPMQKDWNDAGARTLREYLVTLLANVWNQQESFDGKRPFGNSGWDWEVIRPLAKAGIVVATFDEDDQMDIGHDEEIKAHAIIEKAILALGQ